MLAAWRFLRGVKRPGGRLRQDGFLSAADVRLRGGKKVPAA
jgi:hypothetical protein